MAVPSFFAQREYALRRIVILLAALVMVICAVRLWTKPFDGDFKLHREFGRRFLAGEELYAGGLHTPYPPFWAMAHAPAALLPLRAAKALQFPLGVASVALLLWLLRQLGERSNLLPVEKAFWVGAGATFLASRYIIRDMAEAGVNVSLVMLSWLAIYLWQRGRDALAGISLGLAVALKCTPAIFVAYFAWKRQWRFALFAVLATAFFTILPMTVMGPDSYAAHMKRWSDNVLAGVAGPDPSIGVLGPEQLQNMSLRSSLARYLMELPAGHPGRAAHPLYFDALALQPETAAWVIRVFTVTLVLAVFWWARGRPATRDHAAVVWEGAALSIVMLLLSPITWGQHCVALLPAFFFLAAVALKRGTLPRWTIILLAAYALVVLALNRDLIGRELAYLLASYHLETILFALLLFVMIRERARLPRVA